MQPLLNHDELRESIRELLGAESDSHAVRKALDGDARIREQLWAKVAELGWLGLPIQEKFGGLGLSLAEAAIAYEEFGRYLTPAPFMTTLLAAHALSLAGSEEQKSRWLPAIASGQTAASVALPRANGSVKVAPLAGAMRLSGKLHHFVDANVADLLLVPIGDSAGQSGLAIVDRTSSGVEVVARATIDRTRTLNDVTFKDVEVPAERVLPLSAQHWDDLFDHVSVALACDSIGGAAHILEMTVEYLKTRVQFNRPIGSFQALKHRCASWKILQEAAHALTGNAAKMLAADDAGQRASWASSAKFYACDAYASIAGDAVQLHGGIGFTWEHDCHLFLKRAKLNQMLFGSAAEHQERVAKSVLPSTTNDTRR